MSAQSQPPPDDEPETGELAPPIGKTEDELRSEYNSLKFDIAFEEGKLEAWRQVLGNPDVIEVLDLFVTEGEDLTTQLIDCLPKNLIRLQERIKAREELVFRFRQRGDGTGRLQALREKLADFSTRFSLFVHQWQEEDKKP